MNLGDILGRGNSFPDPDEVDPAELERYNANWAATHGVGPARKDTTDSGGVADAFDKAETAKATDIDGTTYKSEFPWLHDPHRGVRWDFDPIELRLLAQENAWVQMLVQSIAKEIAETSWTITESDGRRETMKRLNTHPDERSEVAKDLPDRTAERIFDLLQNPNPDQSWHDMIEMWLSDYLEVGSAVAIKAFPASAYDEDDQLRVQPEQTRPRALKVTAPEVWTKDYDKAGLLEAFWQFENRSAPGGTARSRGRSDPIRFDPAEVMWNDHSPKSNRRYGTPPTLAVSKFLKAIDLAITQEQEYLSRGSTPSGLLAFPEGKDKKAGQERAEVMTENVKGKPWKILEVDGTSAEFTPFTFNFQEMEFTERQRWYARVIAAEFQVPTAVVGVEPEQINYSTFQGERANFESNTLGPYLQDFERWLNTEFIGPHWDGYHFEFTPGLSESTRQLISERVRAEFDANLRGRKEARKEIGLGEELPDDDEFKDDAVEGSDDEGLAGVLGQSVEKNTDTVEKEFAADVFRIVADGESEMFDPGAVLGIGVDFPNDAVYVDWNVDAWPEDEALGGSHVSIYDTIEDAQKVAQGEIQHMDTIDADVVKEFVDTEVAKDEALRNTDDYHVFDVQPSDVEALLEDINDDVAELFDEALEDDELQSIIDRLASDDNAEKSVSALTRRLREILDESDIADSIQTALSERTTAAALEAAREASREAGAGDDVDIEAIRSQLEDRAVEFADDFAEEMAADIRETVAEGWADGENSRTIAEAIADEQDINEGWNGAERIARQELHIATGEARQEVAADLGKVEVWETAGDDRVREAHAAMDGTWRRPGDDWVVEYERGVENESVQGDSEPGIGCRCVTLLADRSVVDNDDYAGDGAL
jgi:phage portal protein BeeE